MLAASSVMALAEEIRTSMWSFLRTHLHPRAAQKALSLIASHPRVARAGGDAHERQLAQPARVRNAPNRSKRRNDTLGGSPWCPLPGRPVVEQSGIEGLLFSLQRSSLSGVEVEGQLWPRAGAELPPMNDGRGLQSRRSRAVRPRCNCHAKSPPNASGCVRCPLTNACSCRQLQPLPRLLALAPIAGAKRRCGRYPPQ